MGRAVRAVLLSMTTLAAATFVGAGAYAQTGAEWAGWAGFLVTIGACGIVGAALWADGLL